MGVRLAPWAGSIVLRRDGSAGRNPQHDQRVACLDYTGAVRDPLHFVSVRHKLALMFVGLCLIAFGLGGYLVSSSARQALEREILERLSFQAQAYATALESQARLLAHRAEDFASDGYIRELAERLPRAVDEAERARLRADLERHLRVNKLPLAKGYGALSVVDPDGHVLASTHTDAAAAERAREGAPPPAAVPVLGELLPPPSGVGAPGLVLATPLHELNGAGDVGRLLVELRVGVWIAAALETARGGEQGQGLAAQLVLADQRGRRLAVPEGFGLGGGPDGTVALEGWGLRLDGAAFDDGDGGWSPVRGEYRKRFPVVGTGWHVEVSLGAEEALSPVSGLQSRYLGVGLLLATLCGALLFFPMRFLARPLVELEQAARRMARGDVSIRVPVTSTDEIGALASGFNQMAQAVQERTERLEASAADLRAGQQALRAERDRLDTVLSSLHDGLVVLDAEGRVVLSNAAASPLVALLAGRGPAVDAHQPCAEAHREGCQACLFDVASAPHDCVLDAGGRVLEVATAPLPRHDGVRPGLVLVARDVTERMAREEREIHQERLAVLGEVGAVMAHELNNPLASISMFNQMLAASLPDGSPLAENVEVIRRNVETCTHTIRELLDYAHGTAPEVGPIDLHETLDDVARFLRPLAERSGVRVSRRLEAPDPWITGDEVQLRQVFVNLVMNAIQAMPAGGEVELATRNACQDGPGSGPECVEVQVRDTGPGIPADVQSHVFRPFFTTKARGDGTGLGLSTARRIAELQGGALWLETSEPGRTVFVVRLKLGQPAELGA